jgi:hypothetical protein
MPEVQVHPLKLSNLPRLPKGSRRAALRAERRWRALPGPNLDIDQTRTIRRRRVGADGLPSGPVVRVSQFKCLGCCHWVDDEEGGLEGGAADFCCAACANKIAERNEPHAAE